MCNFAHLHVHSNQSLIDGLGTPKQIIERAKELGQETIAITDHGVLSSVPDLYNEAKSQGVRIIAGEEFYIVPDATAKGFGPKENLRDRRNYHLTLLAKNEQGYKDLVQLSSKAHRPENFYFRPRIDHNMLREMDTSNIICLSGCVASELSQTFLETIKPYVAKQVTEKFKGKDRQVWKWPMPKKKQKGEHIDLGLAAAEEVLKTYRSFFPEGQFFYEIMYHGLDIEAWTHLHLIDLAKDYGVPLVLTNDAHYAPTEHKQLHDILMCMQWGNKYDASDVDLKNLDICTRGQLEERVMDVIPSVKDFEEAADNTLHIAEMCKDFKITPLDEKKYHIPKFREDGKPVRKAVSRIYELSEKRMGKLCDMYPDRADEYRERFAYEMSIIKRFKYQHYFLDTQDYVRWAKEAGIVVGAGRGSGAGSLVAFCLHITDIDPLQHDLLFERFINPDRASMPDFDTDFQSARVDEVFDYIADKHGIDNVMRVCTFNRMQPKSILKKMGSALGLMSQQALEKLSKEIENDPKLASSKDGVQDWLQNTEVSRLEEFQVLAEVAGIEREDLHHYAEQLFGLPVSVSAHAAAVVITDARRSLKEWVPSQYVPSSKRTVTQYDMDQIEHFGLVKFDVLALGTLDTLGKTFELIGYNPFARMIEEHGALQYDDEKTYELISSVRTDGLFQLTGGTAKQVIRQIGGCHEFEDIVAVMTLGRPGAIAYAGRYREAKKVGADKAKVAHPMLRKLLKTSYGMFLFQEDVMNFGAAIGLEKENRDDLLTAVKKKKMPLFEKVKPDFLEKTEAEGWTEDQQDQVWDQLIAFADYGFNRAHAVSYADLAYKTAYLKANYPAYFIAAKMQQFSTNTTDPKKKSEGLTALVRDAKKMGIRVLPPSVNKSKEHFSAVGKKKIRAGLADVKGVGVKAAREIMKHRPYSADDFEEPYEKVGPRGGITNVGASLGEVNRRTCNSQAIMNLLFAGAIPDIDVENQWEAEKELLHCNISDHPNNEALEYIRETVQSEDNQKLLTMKDADVQANIGGVIERVKLHKDRRNNTMAFIDLDLDGEIYNAVIFAGAWLDLDHHFKEGRLALLDVDVKFDKKRGMSYSCKEAKSWK